MPWIEQLTTGGNTRMPADFVVIRPTYRGRTRRQLPRLAEGTAGWVWRLKDHDLAVEELPTSTVGTFSTPWTPLATGTIQWSCMWGVTGSSRPVSTTRHSIPAPGTPTP